MWGGVRNKLRVPWHLLTPLFENNVGPVAESADAHHDPSASFFFKAMLLWCIPNAGNEYRDVSSNLTGVYIFFSCAAMRALSACIWADFRSQLRTVDGVANPNLHRCTAAGRNIYDFPISTRQPTRRVNVLLHSPRRPDSCSKWGCIFVLPHRLPGDLRADRARFAVV